MFDLNEAKAWRDRAMGDVSSEDWRNRCTELAQLHAAIAQADALTRIATALEAINKRAEVQELFEEDARLEETPHWDTPGGF